MLTLNLSVASHSWASGLPVASRSSSRSALTSSLVGTHRKKNSSHKLERKQENCSNENHVDIDENLKIIQKHAARSSSFTHVNFKHMLDQTECGNKNLDFLEENFCNQASLLSSALKGEGRVVKKMSSHSHLSRSWLLRMGSSSSLVSSSSSLLSPLPSASVPRRSFKTRSRSDDDDSNNFSAFRSREQRNNDYKNSNKNKDDDDTVQEVTLKLNDGRSVTLSVTAIEEKKNGNNLFLSESESSSGSSSEKKDRNFSPSMVLKVGLSAAVLYIGLRLLNGALRPFQNSVKEVLPEEVYVTFSDVRGCDEIKQELEDIVDFLKNPDKFSALGGKLPKGVLLSGPPGTGKTLLAKAVAGEADVPFFYASGAEFDEIFVGQGARRVRALFTAAKQRAPCVIFIDEIDTVGGKRTSTALHPHANQTINQLLSEMDGFVSNEGVIVLGATNRPDALDKALLRPGRFDTKVTVPKPDLAGRTEIINYYLSKIKHDSTVNVAKLARLTIGFSPADLENLVNTSAIRAALDGKDYVTMREFEYAHDKHTLGTDWKSRMRDADELRVTAFHEAGHTLVALFTPDAHPVHKVTIVSKGTSGGHTAFLPEKDHGLISRAQFMAQLDVAMGGRAAEELIFGKDRITGGASSDLAQATAISKEMVSALGMSDKVGLRHFSPEYGDEAGPATIETVDSEISRMLNESYKRATTILKNHRSELESLADALLNYETLDREEVQQVIEGDRQGLDERRAYSNYTSVLVRQNKDNNPGLDSEKKHSSNNGFPNTDVGRPDVLAP